MEALYIYTFDGFILMIVEIWKCKKRPHYPPIIPIILGITVRYTQISKRIGSDRGLKRRVDRTKRRIVNNYDAPHRVIKAL